MKKQLLKQLRRLYREYAEANERYCSALESGNIRLDLRNAVKFIESEITRVKNELRLMGVKTRFEKNRVVEIKLDEENCMAAN